MATSASVLGIDDAHLSLLVVLRDKRTQQTLSLLHQKTLSFFCSLNWPSAKYISLFCVPV